MLASLLFPYDDDARTLICDWLEELELEGCIARYKVDGDTYLEVCNWQKHQKIDKPSPSKYPPFVEDSRILADASRKIVQDQGPRTKDQGEDQGPTDLSKPPVVDETKLEAKRAVEKVFSYYLEKLHRNPDLYQFTQKRKDIGLRRYNECLKSLPEGSDVPGLMRLAIDNLAKSKFHAGENDQGKKYQDWERHLMVSFERLEKWYGEVA